MFHVWSCPALCLCFFCPFSILITLLACWSLCLSCICLWAMHTLICVTFPLSPGDRGCLRHLLVALPGLFCLPFRCYLALVRFTIHFSFAYNFMLSAVISFSCNEQVAVCFLYRVCFFWPNRFGFRTGLANYPFVDTKLKTVWSFVRLHNYRSFRWYKIHSQWSLITVIPMVTKFVPNYAFFYNAWNRFQTETINLN